MQRTARKASLRLLIEAYRRAGSAPSGSRKRGPDDPPLAGDTPMEPRTPSGSGPVLNGGAAAALVFDA